MTNPIKQVNNTKFILLKYIIEYSTEVIVKNNTIMEDDNNVLEPNILPVPEK